MIDNPSLTPVKLAVSLTHDDDGKPLLFVEAGGYFPVPAAILTQLEQVQHHFAKAAENEMITRFVLHAMLSHDTNA